MPVGIKKTETPIFKGTSVVIGAFMRGNKPPVLLGVKKESGATKEKASITQA